MINRYFVAIIYLYVDTEYVKGDEIMAKKDMASLLDSFESDTAKEHDAAVTAAKGNNDNSSRATALVSMTQAEKERLTTIARSHGLSLSAFFRLAADEYITKHDW